MDYKKIVDEMCFLTNTYVDDIGYLLFIMLRDGVKGNKKVEEVVVKQAEEEVDAFEEWFDSL